MASTDNNNPWPADVKHAEGQTDPNVLPEYTLLPASPARSVISYSTANDGPEAALSSPPPSGTNANTNTNTATAESLTIAKLLYMGVLALAVPPLLCVLAGLVAGAMGVYGCGKILEGTGRALAFAPERAYRAWVVQRGRAFESVLEAAAHCEREGDWARERERERERERGEVAEGRVALEDVEAGQGGPISL